MLMISLVDLYPTVLATSTTIMIEVGVRAILSAEEHAKWFTRFDEEVLKPVLDTCHRQDNRVKIIVQVI